MIFILYYYKRSNIAAEPFTLYLSYVMQAAVGSGDIVHMVERDFTDVYGFRNSIRAWRA